MTNPEINPGLLRDALRETLADIRVMNLDQLNDMRAAMSEHVGAADVKGAFAATITAAIDARIIRDRVRDEFRPTFEEVCPPDVDIDRWFENFCVLGRAARVLGSDINVAELVDAAVDVTRAANTAITAPADLERWDER